MLKACVSCPIGKEIKAAQFTIGNLIENAGLKFREEFDIMFITCRTSDEVFAWLKENNFKFTDIPYDEGKGFIHNLYNWWNAGHNEALKIADYAINIGSDHAFYKDCIKNIVDWMKPTNRIVNCKLIEPGNLPTLHTARNFGRTLRDEFQKDEFEKFCSMIHRNELRTDEIQYGHRFDASPYAISKDVWDRFGPMKNYLRPDGVTGDTDLFDRMRAGGVEITKALNAISYHQGQLETQVGVQDGRYT